MNFEINNQSNLLPIFDTKINEVEKEICKVKNWNDQDIQYLMKNLSADRIDLVLKNLIQRIYDWFSKTYYPFKSYLIKGNFVKWDQNDFGRLKSKLDFISDCLIQQNVKYNNARTARNNQGEAVFQNLFECDVCQITFPVTFTNTEFKKHLAEKDHLKNIFQLFSNKSKNTEEKQSINEIEFECEVCKLHISKNDLQNHINDKKHQNKLKQLEIIQQKQNPNTTLKEDPKVTDEIKDNNSIDSDICEITVRREGLFQDYINGRSHQTVLKRIHEKSNLNQDDFDICEVPLKRRKLQEQNHPFSNQLNQKCDEESNANQVQREVVVTQNVVQAQAKDNKKILNPFFSKSVEKTFDNQIQCNVCQVVVPRNGNFKEHQSGITHLANKYQIKMIEHKFPVTVQNIHRQPNKWYCDICKKLIKQGGQQKHIYAKRHRNSLININLYQPNYEEESTNDTVIETKENTESSIIQLKALNPSVYFIDFLTVQISKNVTKPLTIQIISEEYFKCLVCEIMFMKNSSLKSHVLSDTHQCNYNNKNKQIALKIYHTVWRTVPLIWNPQQIFFFPVDENHIFCKLCSSSFEFNWIKAHCNNKMHMRKAIEGVLWSEIGESLYHKESNRLRNLISRTNKYNEKNIFHHTEQFYSDDLLRKLDKKPNRIDKIILMSSPGVYNCLLCQMSGIRGTLLDEHCSSNIHRDFMKNRYQIEIVRQFHRDWSNLPNDFQLHQIYFLPNLTRYNCLCCEKNINFSQIMRHTFHPSHINRFNSLHQNKIPKCFDLTNEWTQIQIYPASLTELFRKSSKNSNKIVVFQRHSLFKIKCLLCKTILDNIYLHFFKKAHRENAQDSEKIEAVKKYHKEWGKIPKNFQIQQLHYEPFNQVSVMCKKCDQTINYENLYSHLTNDHIC